MHATSVIPLGLIVVAAATTAVAVALVAFAVRYSMRVTLTAAFGALALIIAWRILANVLALNVDFMPAVSVGDCGCLIAGGATPYLLAKRVSIDSRQPYLPAIVGAIVGFISNVVIL